MNLPMKHLLLFWWHSIQAILHEAPQQVARDDITHTRPLVKHTLFLSSGMVFHFNLGAKHVALCAFLPRSLKPGGTGLLSKLALAASTKILGLMSSPQKYMLYNDRWFKNLIRWLNSPIPLCRRLRWGSSCQVCQQDGGSMTSTAPGHHSVVKLLHSVSWNLELLLCVPRVLYSPSPQFSYWPATSHWDSTGWNSRDCCYHLHKPHSRIPQIRNSTRREQRHQGLVLCPIWRQLAIFSALTCSLCPPTLPSTQSHDKHMHPAPGIQIHNKDIVRTSTPEYDPNPAFSCTSS